MSDIGNVIWMQDRALDNSEVNARAVMVLAHDAEELSEVAERLRVQIQALATRHNFRFEISSHAASSSPEHGIIPFLKSPVVRALHWALTIYAIVFPSLAWSFNLF